MDFRPYGQHPLPIRRGQGIDRVRDQIHQHLLDLNLFAPYPRQPSIRTGLKGDPMGLQSVANDSQSFLDDIVDIKRRVSPWSLLEMARIFSITESARCPAVTMSCNASLT